MKHNKLTTMAFQITLLWLLLPRPPLRWLVWTTELDLLGQASPDVSRDKAGTHEIAGYDADVVIWDSHPLALGATPKQIFIDGIAQLKDPFSVTKPDPFQQVPKTPNFEKEAKDAVKYDGLPPLTPQKTSDIVVFTNVSNVYVKKDNAVVKALSEAAGGVVVVEGGNIVCSGSCPEAFSHSHSTAAFIDLKGGFIS